MLVDLTIIHTGHMHKVWLLSGYRFAVPSTNLTSFHDNWECISWVMHRSLTLSLTLSVTVCFVDSHHLTADFLLQL